MVAVKVLKEGVSNEARDDFEREVEIMSAFDHDNILKLLGTVSTGKCILLVSKGIHSNHNIYQNSYNEN